MKEIDALAELTSAGWEYVPAGDDEVRIKCPAHEDSNPSVSLNITKNLWNCHGCSARGDIVGLLALIHKCDRQIMYQALAERYGLDKKQRTIRLATIEKYHEGIWKSDRMMEALHNRGVTDESIRKARLGFHEGRITIPVFDERGKVTNVRKYLPGAPGTQKMRNLKGYKTLSLYQIDQCKYKKVWICGGEIKALAASQWLNKMDIGAVAVTAGEGAWDVNFNSHFKDKVVYVCMDIDPKGESAARKVAAYLSYISEVYIVSLPLDSNRYPTGDLNDYIALGEPNFTELMSNAQIYVPHEDDEELVESAHVRLVETTNPTNIGKRMTFDSIIHAMDTTPFLIPKQVAVSCTRDQPICHQCPIYSRDIDNGATKIKVRPTASGILELANAAKKSQRDALLASLNMPNCKIAEFSTKDHYSVYDVRIAPQLEVTGDNTDHVVYPGYVVDYDDLELNTPYEFSGRVYPHPRNQQAVLLLDTVHKAKDNLSAFQLTGTDVLDIFQPDEWTLEGLTAKLNDIYEDLSVNVTRIYQRKELHLAVDLTFHSPLYFYFDDRRQNGWINCLIIGDSAQGKSETTIRLMEHFGLGTRHDCKNASIPGILGGLQQLNNRWFVSWGVVPTHDRRLVVLEEVKGMPQDLFSKLTDMRSSGIAEISKIEKRKAHARTRCIMISNPRSNRPISAFGYGIESIRELVGSLEDIRRFDFAVIVSSGQIDASEINRLSVDRPAQEHRYTRSLCQTAVLWAWTRTPEQITWEDARCCIDYAIQLSDKFTDIIPLVDQGTMRFKLARIAIALAARTYSHDGRDGILVRRCHIQYAHKFLDAIYSANEFGYLSLSESIKFQSSLVDEATIQAQLYNTKCPRDLVEGLLHTDHLTRNDIMDFGGLDQDNAQNILSLLVRKHALKRKKRFYEKTSSFIAMLKSLDPPLEPESQKGEF
jgi:hypothetical protein